MRVLDRPAEETAELWSLIPLECYVVAAAIFITAACNLLVSVG